MSSTYGALKTLMTMLTAAPTLSGASLFFGEEYIVAQEKPYPYVVVVPIGGDWGPPGTPGYAVGTNVDVNNIWMTGESIDLYLAAYDDTPGADAVDHATAVEELRASVLQALQYQAPNGLKFFPVNGRWETKQNEVNRFGRSYVLTVKVDITIPDVSPVDVTVEDTTITATIVEEA